MSTFRIKIETTAPQLSKQLRRVAEREIPFASTVALTRVAVLARDRVRGEMRFRFKLRSKRPPKGVIAIPAQKSHLWPKSEVAVRDAFMALHATGGIKRPQKKAKNVAIPTSIVQRTGGGAVRAAQKPRRLGASKNARWSKGRPGDLTDSPALLAPAGAARVRGNKTGTGLWIYFLFRRTARIKKRWPFESTIERAVRQNYQQQFLRALRESVASTKARNAAR